MTSTGIQLNNHMDDFDTPGEKNKVGLGPNTVRCAHQITHLKEN